VVRRPSARKIDTISQPVVFQAWPCTPSALSVRPPVRLTETTAELGHSSGRTAIVGKASGPTKECGISVQNARRIAIVVEIVGLLHKPSLGILLSREVSPVLSHRGWVSRTSTPIIGHLTSSPNAAPIRAYRVRDCRSARVLVRSFNCPNLVSRARRTSGRGPLAIRKAQRPDAPTATSHRSHGRQSNRRNAHSA
jgi:hypothetical protein